MKHPALFAFCMLFLTGTAFSQYQAGQFHAGGSAGLILAFQEEDPDIWGFSVSPSLGFSLTNEIEVGISPALSYYDFGPGMPTYSLAAFLRFNRPLTGAFGMFGAVTPGIEYSTYKADSYHSTRQAFTTSGSAGVYYFLTPRFSLETTVGAFTYSHERSEFNSDFGDIRDTQNTWNLGLWAPFSFSLFYHFQ